jgi:APA family basic amino acid/polyamine antiporter
MIVVSPVIGIGIFRTSAMVAQATKTPLLFYSAWILGGFISLLGALTFAEIGSRFPKPGAYYKVVAESYHSSLAFMFNWTGILIANGTGAAAALILFLFVINYLGIKTGAWAQNVLTLLKVGMILMLVFTAFHYKCPPAEAAEKVASNQPFWLALGVGLIAVFYTQGGYQNTINFGADSALLGTVIFASGYPIFLFMRRFRKKSL